MKICQCPQVCRMTTIRSSQEICFTGKEKNNLTITLLCGRTKPCCLPWQTFKIMNKIKGSFSVFFSLACVAMHFFNSENWKKKYDGMSSDSRQEGRGKGDKACTIQNPVVTNFSFIFYFFLIRVKNDVPSRWWSSEECRFPLVPDTTSWQNLKLYKISVCFCISLVFFCLNRQVFSTSTTYDKNEDKTIKEKKNVNICKNIFWSIEAANNTFWEKLWLNNSLVFRPTHKYSHFT